MPAVKTILPDDQDARAARASGKMLAAMVAQEDEASLRFRTPAARLTKSACVDSNRIECAKAHLAIVDGESIPVNQTSSFAELPYTLLASQGGNFYLPP